MICEFYIPNFCKFEKFNGFLFPHLCGFCGNSKLLLGAKAESRSNLSPRRSSITSLNKSIDRLRYLVEIIADKIKIITKEIQKLCENQNLKLFEIEKLRRWDLKKLLSKFSHLFGS